MRFHFVIKSKSKKYNSLLNDFEQKKQPTKFPKTNLKAILCDSPGNCSGEAPKASYCLCFRSTATLLPVIQTAKGNFPQNCETHECT